jgi:hypothetical protein
MRRRAIAIAALLWGFAAPALAAPKCETELARLEGPGKRVFMVDGYGGGGYFESTGRGRSAHYVHVWRGQETGQASGVTRFLIFTVIPGTSGPNWGSLSDPKEIKAKFRWRTLDATEIEDAIRVYGGPLEGEWKLACHGRPPIKVSFPRFADYPASGKPYAGRIARMKVPRGLGENLRLRVKESLGDDDKPGIAGRYIRLTWPCGTACVGTGLMDAKTGRVIMLPHMSGWGDVTDAFEPIEGRLNSRLVVLSGIRDEKGISGRHFYVLDNGRLKYLRSVEVERSFPQKLE